MNAKHAVFLVFLALGGPVLLFLFLKVFGRNEFQVAPLYQQPPLVAPDSCNYRYNVPYHVADSVMSRLKPNTSDSLFVVYFNREEATAINRIRTEFLHDPVAIVGPDAVDKLFDADWLRRCVLLMKGDTSVALVDGKYRIRGNYYGADRDDVDRLSVELKIILRKY